MAKNLPRCLLGLGLLMTPIAAQAVPVPIATLYNTGVDDNRVPLPNNGGSDPHYSLISAPAPSTTQTVAYQGVGANGLFPIGPWAGNDGLSSWIAPDNSGSRTDNPAGRYYYQTTFDLTGYDPRTAVIYGAWAGDDGGFDLLLNGVSQGILTSLSLGAQNYNQLVPFTYFTRSAAGVVSGAINTPLQSGFLPGLNTLVFRVDNAGGATGLRTELIGTAELLPEPASLGVLGLGLVAVLVVTRRRAL